MPPPLSSTATAMAAQPNLGHRNGEEHMCPPGFDAAQFEDNTLDHAFDNTPAAKSAGQNQPPPPPAQPAERPTSDDTLGAADVLGPASEQPAKERGGARARGKAGGAHSGRAHGVAIGSPPMGHAALLASPLTTKLFVGGLPPSITDMEVHALFACYGEVIEVHVMGGKARSGQCCAFVNVGTPAVAHAAITGLHQTAPFPAVDASHPAEPIVVSMAKDVKAGAAPRRGSGSGSGSGSGRMRPVGFGPHAVTPHGGVPYAYAMQHQALQQFQQHFVLQQHQAFQQQALAMSLPALASQGSPTAGQADDKAPPTQGGGKHKERQASPQSSPPLGPALSPTIAGMPLGHSFSPAFPFAGLPAEMQMQLPLLQQQHAGLLAGLGGANPFLAAPFSQFAGFHDPMTLATAAAWAQASGSPPSGHADLTAPFMLPHLSPLPPAASPAVSSSSPTSSTNRARPQDGHGVGGTSQGIKLFVGDLPANITEATLRTKFSEFGRVQEVHVMRGKSKTGAACAFVVVLNSDVAQKAITALDKKKLTEDAAVALSVRYADSQKREACMRANGSISSAGSCSPAGSPCMMPSSVSAAPTAVPSPAIMTTSPPLHPSALGFGLPGAGGLLNPASIGQLSGLEMQLLQQQLLAGTWAQQQLQQLSQFQQWGVQPHLGTGIDQEVDGDEDYDEAEDDDDEEGDDEGSEEMPETPELPSQVAADRAFMAAPAVAMRQ